MPGLIEGASLGRGLGVRFLKHLERTRLLVHLIDGGKLLKEFGGEDAQVLADAANRDKEIIDAELYTFSPELSDKPQIIAFNKMDLYSDEIAAKISALLKKKYPQQDVVLISGAAHQGLDDLIQIIGKHLFVKKSLNRDELNALMS